MALPVPEKPPAPEINYSDLLSHPIVDGLEIPMMPDDDFKKLKGSISREGLHRPITLFEGKTLDGRNRYKALVQLQQEKALKIGSEHFTEYKGTSPIEYAISVNIQQRNLNESQRALMAAKLVNTNVGANRYTLRHYSLTVDNAAKLFKVSTGSIETAKAMLTKAAPEVVAAVQTGTKRLGAVAEIIKLPKEKQVAELSKPRKPRQSSGSGSKTSIPVPAVNQRMTDVDEVKTKWKGFNDLQKRAFVETYHDEIAKIVQDIDDQRAMVGVAAE
jgi:hypothetical protein